MSIVMARRSSGPEFLVMASSNSCRKSNISRSGGVSTAKLSRCRWLVASGGWGWVWGRRDGEFARTSESKHLVPVVAVQVVHGAAGAHEEHIFFPQRAEGCADLDVVMGVVSCVHADDGRGRGAVGEHADEDEIGVVD